MDEPMESVPALAAIAAEPRASVTAVITDPRVIYPGGYAETLAVLYASCRVATRYVVFFWHPRSVPRAPPGWHETARHVWQRPSRKGYEAIVVWSTHPRSFPSRVWTTTPESNDQKSPILLRHLVASYSNPGDTVLDPFAHDASIAVACRHLRRAYHGIGTTDGRHREAADESPRTLRDYSMPTSDDLSDRADPEV